MSDRIIILLFMIIPFVIIPVALFHSNKKRKAALSKLSSCLSGSVSKFSFFSTFNGEYQGLKFSISLLPGGENSPPYLRIVINKKSSFRLRIYRESFMSAVGKKIGLVREVKITDELFDREFLIFSNDSTLAGNYLSNANIRNAIRELFTKGFVSLAIDGRNIVIQKPNYILESDLEPSQVTNTLQKLSLLAMRL